MIVKGIIPARYKSSRFPGKPLEDINGIPLVIRVAQLSAIAMGNENIYVATDNNKIADVVKSFGFNVIMTSENCLTGTDRLSEVSKSLEADIYINIQGDEPLLKSSDIKKVISAKESNFNYVINGMKTITEEEAQNINIPKVVTNSHDQLIYISRSKIPGSKTGEQNITFKKQVCVYGFNRKELASFSSLGTKSEIERIEDIEILRFIDLNIPVKMIMLEGSKYAVDTPEDVIKVENYLRTNM